MNAAPLPSRLADLFAVKEDPVKPLVLLLSDAESVTESDVANVLSLYRNLPIELAQHVCLLAREAVFVFELEEVLHGSIPQAQQLHRLADRPELR